MCHSIMAQEGYLMFNWLRNLLTDTGDKAVRQIQPFIQKINSLENSFSALSDEELRAHTTKFREKIQDAVADINQEIETVRKNYLAERDLDKRRSLDDVLQKLERERDEITQEELDAILPEAFAVVREAAKRTIGQRHFDVQLIGGVVLHQGKIAEMKTGEGKTLTASLPLYLNALAGRGAHLVTVNDYLAKVGAGWMGQIYHFLGLSVGFIAHDYSAIYDPDFVDPNANQEDQRLVHWRPCTRREAYYCDITYGTNNEFGFDYLRDNMAVELDQMVQRELYFAIVDEVDNILIDEARTPLIISGPSNKSSDEYRRVARIAPNLKPSTVSQKEVKEGAEYDGDFWIDERSKSISLTDQGIEKVERLLGIPEDESLYDPKYFELTHFVDNALKAQFIYHRDRDYVVEPDGEIVIVDEFTGRKMPGRRWSDGLHQAVEAKESLLNPRVKIKNENVTLATITFQNYFRMYRKLAGMTGTAWTEREELGKIYNLDVVVVPTNRPMQRQDLPDQIYRTEQAKFNAVLKELKEIHETGRPVLVGTTSVETSERLSELLRRNGIKHNVLNAKHHEREAAIVAQAGRKGAVTIATNMAGRGTDILLGGNPDGLIEDILHNKGIAFEKATPEELAAAKQEAEEITSKEREEVVALGGLHIIGTERHEARRIDNQLRGRAGRQGDPGSSRFFMSLEDDLMRRFGPMERIKGIMERLGVEDDMPIQAGIINKSIEGAQTRVEGFNFDVRKHTVEFDDVVNKQRQIIYSDRRAILSGKDMHDEVLQMIGEEIASLVDEHLPADDRELWDFEALLRAIKNINPLLGSDFTADKLAELTRDEIESMLVDEIEAAYAKREEAIGSEQMRFVERRMMLGAIDRQWVDYLTAMDDLRQSISLQAFAQRDPLVEFKRKSFDMFDELKANITHDIVYNIIPASFQYEQYLRQIKMEQEARLASAQRVGDTEEAAKAAKPIRRTVQMPGRNDPCPCGSGRKFKQCHLGRESEIMHLIQAGATAQPAPASVSAQLATGRSSSQANNNVAQVAEAIKKANGSETSPATSPVGRGRAVPRGRAAPAPKSAEPVGRGKKK